VVAAFLCCAISIHPSRDIHQCSAVHRYRVFVVSSLSPLSSAACFSFLASCSSRSVALQPNVQCQRNLSSRSNNQYRNHSSSRSGGNVPQHKTTATNADAFSFSNFQCAIISALLHHLSIFCCAVDK